MSLKCYLERDRMKHQTVFDVYHHLVFAGLFSCANPASSPTSQYTVTLTGTVVNAIGTKLDSVHIVVWYPFSQDTVPSNGSFSIAFSAQDKNTVSDSMTLSRSGFFSSTKYFSYNSTATTVLFLGDCAKGDYFCTG